MNYRALKRLNAVLFLLSLIVLLYPIRSLAGNRPQDSEAFKRYWYSGKAELTRYDLHQARYGEMRHGDAVLIFVTEDFLKDKQVKHEYGSGANAISVLKLNLTRKFNTGVYPYSMMTSIFTPVDISAYPRTLKTTTSVQEWCGHVFQQLNLRGGKYDVELRSYFQRESDRDFSLKPTLLEDEIWTRIRLAPDSLPTGRVKIIPGGQYERLRHKEIRPEDATASFTTESDPALRVYTVDYKSIKRKLVIKFEKEFPYKIVEWEETTPSGFGPKQVILTTRAVKTNSIYTDYWHKNRVMDAPLRKELGL